MGKIVKGIRVVNKNEGIERMLEKEKENVKWFEDAGKSHPFKKLLWEPEYGFMLEHSFTG